MANFKKITPEISSQALEKVQSVMQKSLDDLGITSDLLAHKLRDELEATETKTFQYKGTTIESQPKVAWEVRQRARESAHKLRGDFIERKQISIDGQFQAVPLNDEQQAELEAMKEALLLQMMKKRELVK